MKSPNVVKQLSFFMFPSILTFDFDLILGLFLTFWGFVVVVDGWWMFGGGGGGSQRLLSLNPTTVMVVLLLELWLLLSCDNTFQTQIIIIINPYSPLKFLCTNPQSQSQMRCAGHI